MLRPIYRELRHQGQGRNTMDGLWGIYDSTSRYNFVRRRLRLPLVKAKA